MTRVNAAWLQPVSTAPELLVNRDAERDDLLHRLHEFREAGIRDAHVLITGARGVGKSIFTRVVLRDFEREGRDAVITVTVDGRGLRYRSFLKRFANNLADAIRPRAELGRRTVFQAWADHLSLLANNDQVTRGQTDTVTRKYGVDATASTDVLLYKLQGRFAWEETRSLGQTIQTTLTVTDDLLHAAIVATLERLTAKDSPWFVVVFLDDLDQAAPGDRENDIAPLFAKVLELRPCISLVHFRTEALVENVSREAAEKIDLRPLEPVVMIDLLHRRLDAATDAVRRQFPASTDWSAVESLAKQTGTPLVFLKWVHGLLRTQDWPPTDLWKERAELLRLVFSADPFNGVEPELMQRLVDVVDRCDAGIKDRAIRRDDLERGCLVTDRVPAGSGLTPQEIEDLIKLNVLLPRHRLQPTLGFRLQPVLDLLRPSVREKL